MRLWDYHTHNFRCHHATGTLVEYVETAITRGLQEIGLSDHFPMYLLPKSFQINAMSREEFPEYLKEVQELRERYQDQITIKVGIEVDFYPPEFSNYQAALRPVLDSKVVDYIIGSIHMIPWPGYEYVPIDNDARAAHFEVIGPDRIYEAYWDMQRQLVESNFFQIWGHGDSIKASRFVHSDEQRIWEKILRVVDALEKSDMSVEVNTAGLRKWGEQCPSERIIRELIARNIPITLGSDAHAPEYVAYEFKTMVKLLRKWGLRALCQWTRGEKTIIPLK